MLQHARNFALLSFMLGGMSVFGQTYKAIDFLKSSATEILKIDIIRIDTCSYVNAGGCTSSVKSKVIEVYKQSNLPRDVKEISFAHYVNFDLRHAPKDRMLKVGGTYIIFISADPKDDARKLKPNATVVYGLVDSFLGVIEYNPDLEEYLRYSEGSSKKK